jgi:formate dehydrogenase major subunit
VFDADKRFAPTFDEEMVNEFEADTVIFATGQGADVADLGLPLTARGSIEIDPLTLRTGREKVYAAGDVVSGPTKVIDAIAAGQRAAASIWRDLTGDKSLVEKLDSENAVLGKVPDAMGAKVEQKRRIEMEKLEFYDAVKNFEEVELGYTEYEAAREAQRCLGCTTGARLEREKCASCLTCMRVCPHGAPTIKVGGYVYFDAEACHACGACASQCPAQAIHLEGHSEEEIDRRAAIALTNGGLDTSMQFACSCTPVLPDLGLTDVRTITLTCLLRVSERAVLHALNNGAQRVVFSGCVESNCRYPYARPLVARRMEDIRSLLAQAGIEGAFIVPEETDEDTAVHLR